MDLLDQIPGYREALDRESQSRRGAFLGLPEIICGLSVLPLTLSHLLLLQFAGSPFILTGRTPTPGEIAQFLWIVSPQYDRVRELPADTWEFRRTRWRFLRSIRKLDYVSVCKSISVYVDESFQDSPGGSGENRIEHYSGVASIVAAIAAELHWSEAEILRIPLKRIFQYQRCIIKRHDSKAIFFNPSDRIRGEWLSMLNGGGRNHE